MTIPPDTTVFLAEFERQEVAPKTIASYRGDLVHFATWFTGAMDEDCAAAAVTRTDLRHDRGYPVTVELRAPRRPWNSATSTDWCAWPGNGGKYRQTTLNVDVGRALEALPAARPAIVDDHLVIGQRGYGLKPQPVEHVVRKYARRAASSTSPTTRCATASATGTWRPASTW